MCFFSNFSNFFQILLMFAHVTGSSSLIMGPLDIIYKPQMSEHNRKSGTCPTGSFALIINICPAFAFESILCTPALTYCTDFLTTLSTHSYLHLSTAFILSTVACSVSCWGSSFVWLAIRIVQCRSGLVSYVAALILQARPDLACIYSLYG